MRSADSEVDVCVSVQANRLVWKRKGELHFLLLFLLRVMFWKKRVYALALSFGQFCLGKGRSFLTNQALLHMLALVQTLGNLSEH